MTEDERVAYINKESSYHLEELLKLMEEGTLVEEDMLAIAYASMVIVATMGFSPKRMSEDAIIAADKLLSMVEEPLPEATTCVNKDQDGNCPLHNLHCQYPDCETVK
jgi:hypothetical protein